jgi:hypothetical protein
MLGSAAPASGDPSRQRDDEHADADDLAGAIERVFLLPVILGSSGESYTEICKSGFSRT